MFQKALSNSGLNKLTVLTIKTFVAEATEGDQKIRKLSDGGGLFLVVTPAKTALWRLKYHIGNKEKTYSIGLYPMVSLEVARKQRDILRLQIGQGNDPVSARRVKKAENVSATDQSFESAFRMWLTMKEKEWSPHHFKISKRAIERDVLPTLGKLPIRDITPSHVSGVIEQIAKRGIFDTVSKILQHCSGVFRMAQARGWCRDNPASPVREMLPKKRIKGFMPAVLNFEGLGEILRLAEAARLSPAVRMAHRLTAFSTARMGNVTLAEWPEFQLEGDTPMWLIPRKKMKAQDRTHDHKIILSKPVVQELKQWREKVGGNGYLFLSPTQSGNGNQPITRESVEKVYRVTLGLKDKHTPHGWRAAFSTLARDNGFNRDVVELALDHIHDNEIARAYDRGERLSERIKLMNWWGEQLIGAERGNDLIQFPTVKAA